MQNGIHDYNLCYLHFLKYTIMLELNCIDVKQIVLQPTTSLKSKTLLPQQKY